MDEGIVAAVILLVIFSGITSIIKAFADASFRKRILDRSNLNSETLDYFKNELNLKRERYPSLKWGLIIFFAGIGFIIINYYDRHFDQPISIGILAIGISIGFLLYYFIVKKEEEKNS